MSPNRPTSLSRLAARHTERDWCTVAVQRETDAPRLEPVSGAARSCTMGKLNTLKAALGCVVIAAAAASVVVAIGASGQTLTGGLRDWFSPPGHAQTSKPSGGLPDFADLVDRVKPAVIGLRVQVEVEDATVGLGSPLD